jgi:DNA-binding response OmpR family regulator
MYPEGQEILVVVDDHEAGERIARILRDEGFAVTAAAAGLAALRAINTHRFAAIVASTRLPGSLDGRTTVRQARARQPRLKALFVDDRRSDDTRPMLPNPALSNPDSDDLIFAPFERHELVGCVFELLHREMAATGDLARRARTALRAW